MPAREPRLAALRTGVLLGGGVVFVVVVAIALAFGVDAGYALAMGLGLGIFVGGGLGFLIAARIDQERSF